MSQSARKQASKPKAKASSRRKPASQSPWVLPRDSARKPAGSSKAAKPRKASAAPRRRGQGLDINGATFEQLREVGLSIDQSARLIEQRRLHGAFKSFDDLAKLRGFSKRKLGEFGAKLQIG